MADIRIGGANGEDGLTYIGNIGEVWIDKNNNLRRSDGQTQGGIIISGGAGFDGQYSSLTGKPTIPTDVSNLTDTTNLLSDTFSGSYNDLTNKPALFDGDYTNLTNKPALFDGDYTNLTNKPALFDGAFSSLSGTPSLFSGSYNDLTNKPTLFDGQFSSLTGTPTTLAGYGITDGGSSYSDSDVASYLNGNLDTHILPDTNATYDIGSASFKIRHLFLSDNSLYIGDNTLRTAGNNLLFDGEDIQDYNNLKNKPDLSAIATISQSTVTLPTFTTEQSNISSDDNNPTDFDPNVYSAFFVWGNFNLNRKFNLLDGSYDGQVVRIHPQRAGGGNLTGTIKMFDAFTGTVVQSTSQSGGTFVWNGSCWFRTALVA